MANDFILKFKKPIFRKGSKLGQIHAAAMALLGVMKTA
jgi:hypothetical protein